MIILSQDKTKAINFDRVESIGISVQNKKQIFCGFNHGSMVIGEYETEERAKEVLNNITGFFSFESVSGTYQEIRAKIEITKLARYKMPEK